MDDQHISEVFFVKIKSGNSQLSVNERSLCDAIQQKRVSWHEHRVNHTLHARAHSSGATNHSLIIPHRYRSPPKRGYAEPAYSTI
jgi:hypothetical protein